MNGRVYLVGAGPGDAGLLTVRGRRLLETADAVVYDRLISPRLLDFVPPQAKRIYVGKSAGRHVVRQTDIQRLLVDLAHQHRTVVRLKGGDPFVFGRGGEEAAWLTDHGVPWEVVPGVTSTVAVPGYSGIPVTHRGLSDGFMVITGQTGTLSELDVTTAVPLLLRGGTLIVLMGMGRLAEISQLLQAHGISPNLPAAATAWGTRAAQRTVRATLCTLAERVRAEELAAPAVVVIGRVAALHDELAWWQARPLAGRRLLLAVETEAEAARLGGQLDELGAEFVTFVAARQAVIDRDRLDLDVARVRYGGRGKRCELIFESAIDVVLFFEQVFADGMDIRDLFGARLHATTPSAVQALRRLGVVPDVSAATAAPVEALGASRPAVYATNFTVPEHVRELVTVTGWLPSASVDGAAPDAADGVLEAVWASSSAAWWALAESLGLPPDRLPGCIWRASLTSENVYADVQPRAFAEAPFEAVVPGGGTR